MQRKLISRDPQRRAILARIRRIWRHLPRQGRLLFFDVKPIAVKAYGGRRYTAAKRLVLSRAQKTRGLFYLFVAYDVISGRVYWAFYPGKSAHYVCQFMRRMRRWFPKQPLWIALDQDRAHPCKSLCTRRVMRALHLHWISLPKASPDDNPVEVVFSDIQLMILDNSDDPDTRATQRRISRHLRHRNRRKDRYIHIPYLYGFSPNIFDKFYSTLCDTTLNHRQQKTSQAYFTREVLPATNNHQLTTNDFQRPCHTRFRFDVDLHVN